jgi:hypothetical protein
MTSLSPEDAGRVHAMIAKGRREHPDFAEKGSMVVGLAADPDSLASALAGMEDGHKILMRLAEDEDAVDLLQHRGATLGAALGKYAGRTVDAPAKEAAAQSAPAPRAKAETPRTSADAADMKEYDRLRTAETTSRQKPPAPKIMDASDPKIPLREFFTVRDLQERERHARRRAR